MNLILTYNDRNIMFRNKSISELNHFMYLISCDALIIHYCGEFVNSFFRILIIYFSARTRKYIIDNWCVKKEGTKVPAFITRWLRITAGLRSANISDNQNENHTARHHEHVHCNHHKTD